MEMQSVTECFCLILSDPREQEPSPVFIRQSFWGFFMSEPEPKPTQSEAEALGLYRAIVVAMVTSCLPQLHWCRVPCTI